MNTEPVQTVNPVLRLTDRFVDVTVNTYAKQGKQVKYKIPIFTKELVGNQAPHPGTGSFPKNTLPKDETFVILGHNYDNVIMRTEDFKNRVDVTLGEPALQEQHAMDAKSLVNRNRPFDMWQSIVVKDRTEMEDLKKDSFPSIYDLSNKRFDTWKRSWSTIAGVVYDLYEKPSRWNVYARYFNPRAIEYDIVLTPGTWGRGGEAVTKDLLTRWKDEALKDQLGKARVTVQDTVDSSQFLEIGCHPFEFYRTWIMRDHFDKWVAALCVKGHAGEAGLVRRHPTEDDNECIKAINPEFAYSWTERQNKKAKEDERADQTGISSKVGKKMKINESSTVPVFTDLNSDIEKIESPQVIPDANSKVGRTEEKAQIKAAQKKKLHGVVETCTITITNQKKIQGTVGVKREVSQKDIMFGTSATELAAVLWEFEVKEGERRPIVAEWLHRSAFSFGGLGFPVELNILSTVQQNSQHGNNLVFGTSEANTAMLRYEIAIKDVVMHCASTYPYIACEVNTALEGLDESEPYSAWYSPKILYLYSVTFGDRDTSKTHASSEFQVGKFDTDAKGFDLYSRYRPFLFEGKIDEGLMKAFADLVSKHAVKFKE